MTIRVNVHLEGNARAEHCCLELETKGRARKMGKAAVFFRVGPRESVYFGFLDTQGRMRILIQAIGYPG